MGDSHTWAAVPGAAQRARSVLAVAWSCTVTTEGCPEEFTGAHSVTGEGRVLLRAPEDSALAGTALLAPRGELPALLEFADVAPVPVRDRIRARLRLAGRFTRAGDHLLFQPMRVVLRQAPGAVVVAPADFAAAEPDPLAMAEARLLTHLADTHPDAVERLTRLVGPDSLHGAVRVRPLAVDRHALTLRIERARTDGDVRLPFHAPADDITQLTERMHVLLARAGANSCARALQRQRTDGGG